MTQPRWREWPPDIQSVLFLTVPVIPEWSFCFPTATTRFIWSARTGRGTARYQLNGDLWPTGFPSALGVRDSLPVNKSAVIRGYKTGAVSFGLENAPGTYYQRLQINPNGTVVYYYLPEGATTLKTATLVHLEDLLWLCWRQQNGDLANAIASKPCNLSGGTVEFIIDISNLQIKRFALHVTCSGSIWAEFVLLIISYSDLSASLEEAGITKVKLYSTYDSKMIFKACTVQGSNGKIRIQAQNNYGEACMVSIISPYK